MLTLAALGQGGRVAGAPESRPSERVVAVDVKNHDYSRRERGEKSRLPPGRGRQTWGGSKRDTAIRRPFEPAIFNPGGDPPLGETIANF